MRRIFALILTAVMLTFIMVSVTGCSAAKITLGMGQWLTMINDAFGMNSYTSDEPYLTTVAADNRYFAAVLQGCAAHTGELRRIYGCRCLRGREDRLWHRAF